MRTIGIWIMRLSVALLYEKGTQLLWVKEKSLSYRVIVQDEYCTTEVFDQQHGWQAQCQQSLQDFQKSLGKYNMKGTWVIKKYDSTQSSFT